MAEFKYLWGVVFLAILMKELAEATEERPSVLEELHTTTNLLIYKKCHNVEKTNQDEEENVPPVRLHVLFHRKSFKQVEMSQTQSTVGLSPVMQRFVLMKQLHLSIGPNSRTSCAGTISHIHGTRAQWG